MRSDAFVVSLFAAAATLACAGAGVSPAPAAAPAPAQAAEPPRPAAAPTPAPAASVAEAASVATPGPATPGADLMGDYGVAIAYGGQPMEFVLSMVRDEQGKVGGSIYIDQFGTIAFNSVVVEGKHVTASLGSPDGSTVSMDFTVDAGELAGSWRSSNGDGSAIRGRKLK